MNSLFILEIPVQNIVKISKKSFGVSHEGVTRKKLKNEKTNKQVVSSFLQVKDRSIAFSQYSVNNSIWITIIRLLGF